MGLNTVRDADNLEMFYANVPLNRQHAGRQVLQLASRVVARSPFYQEGLMRILERLIDSTLDGDDLYGMCLDASEVISGDLLAVNPESGLQIGLPAIESPVLVPVRLDTMYEPMGM